MCLATTMIDPDTSFVLSFFSVGTFSKFLLVYVHVWHMNPNLKGTNEFIIKHFTHNLNQQIQLSAKGSELKKTQNAMKNP